ncbi:MAG: OmpL47-type beta-barrel domain-containing protein [Thermomicrobiales bacterium]
MEDQLVIEIIDPHPTVPPGGQVAMAIRIRNDTARSGRFRLTITGPPAAWIEDGDVADGVRVAAGGSVTVTVGLRVPETATPTNLPLMVSLTADDDPEFGSSTFGAVSIVPLEEIAQGTAATPLPVVESSASNTSELPEEPVEPTTRPSDSPEPLSEPAPPPMQESVPAPSSPSDRPTTEIDIAETKPVEADAGSEDLDRPTEPLPVIPSPAVVQSATPPAPPPKPPQIGPIGLSLREAGDQAGSYLARLRNGGRIDVDLALDVVSEADLEIIRPDGPFPVAPGGSLEVPLRLTPRGAQNAAIPFRVRALGPDQQILAEVSSALVVAPSPVVSNRPRGSWLAIGGVAAVVLIAVVAAAWFFLLRDGDDDEWPERPVLETASSVTIQPRGDKSILYAREAADDPDSDWIQIAERDAVDLPGLFATLTARSPDQQQVLFVTAADEQLNDAELWLARADGSEDPRRLAVVEQGLWPAQPTWSPDGSRIAFAVREGPALRLMTVPVGGGDPQPVEPTPDGFGPEAFYGANPVPLQWIDNQTLGFYTTTEDGGRQLHQVDVETGRAQVLDAPPVPQQAGDLTTPCLDTAFSQNDPRWSAQTLAPVDEEIGVAGCGLTAAASVLAAFDTGSDPGELAECLNAESASAPVDWATVSSCGDDLVTFSEPGPFSYEELNIQLSGDWPIIVRLKGGPTGEHFVVVNTGPGSGSGLASDFRVTDPWDGTTWKTLAFFTSKGYVPDALIVYQGQQTNCTVITGTPPQNVRLISPSDQSVSTEAQTLDFEVQGAAPGDVIESSIDDGERIDDEGVHLVTITATRDGADTPYLRESIAFTIDRTAPRTSATIDGAAAEDETYQGSVAIALAAADGLSAVSRIEYRLDGAEDWQTYSTDTVSRPIAVVTAGAHTLEYRSVDMAGNEEASREINFDVVVSDQPGSPAAGPTEDVPAATATATTAPPAQTEVVPSLAPATPTVVAASTTPAEVALPAATASPTPLVATASPISVPSAATVLATSTVAAATSTASPAPATPAVAATSTTAASPAATAEPTATATVAPASPTATLTATTAASPTATAEPTSTVPPALMVTATAMATTTATSVPTPSPTLEAAAAPTETVTPQPTATTAPTATATSPPTVTATATATPASTATPTPRPASTATPRPTATVTAAATATPRPTTTPTPEPTEAATAEPTASATVTPSPTETPSPTAEPTSTATPEATSTLIPTVPPVPVAPTPAPASPTATPGEVVAQDCQSPVESDPGVELLVVSDLRLSTTEPGRMRFLGEISNDGDQPVEAIITVCLAGTTFQPSAIPGPILPGESAPFVFLLDGDDASVAHGVAVSGFVITEAEITATRPNVVIVDEEMHEPDASHPTMWLSLTFRNDGEITANVVQATIVLYQANGDLREVKTVNIRLDNPEAGVAGLEAGQAAATEILLDGIRSMSGEYDVRLVGIAEADDEGTPTGEDTQTA